MAWVRPSARRGLSSASTVAGSMPKPRAMQASCGVSLATGALTSTAAAPSPGMKPLEFWLVSRRSRASKAARVGPLRRESTAAISTWRCPP
ncbi:hypothetical protein D3C78_256740 [compost metagenome]